MPPMWKVKREFWRAVEHVKITLLDPFWRIAQYRYDRQRHQHIAVEAGSVELSRDIAIFVVFQPKRIPDSIFASLDHFVEKGFSPFVVLQCAPSEGDMARLKSMSSVVMKRRNFGYDFGGYRDAVLYLQEHDLPFDNLVFINDSIWFPVFRNCDHLDRIRSLDENLVGYSFAVAKNDRNNEHVQSYFFAFSGLDARKKKAFFDYWKNLRLASDRQFTIRNCEMKMTAHFKREGFSLGWLFSLDDISNYVNTATQSELDHLVEFYVAIGHKHADLFTRLSGESSDELRKAKSAEVASGAIGRNIIGAAPEFVFNDLKFSAMKKSVAYNYCVQKRIFLRDCVSDEVEPIVLNEIKSQMEKLGWKDRLVS